LLEDETTPRKQKERVVINDVWFNELTLMQFELGQPLTKEFPFGFDPDSLDFPDEINE
jgi:hypothetical protein